MSVAPRSDRLVAERLGPGDLLRTFAFLDQDPVLNVYLEALLLRDALGRPQDEFWGVRRDGAWTGIVYLGGTSGAVLPVGDDAEAMRALGRIAIERLPRPQRFQIIGARAAVDPFVERFARSGLLPRLDRAQTYMALEPGDLPAFERLPELRAASRDDLALVYESGAELRAEELEEDPRLVDPIGYRRRVEDECRDAHTWLWIGDEGLRFRSSVSAVTADSAQVSGVYTPPGHRGRGHARRALSELCLRLFTASRTVCLFVNDSNAPAIALYRRMGFRDRAPWRSLFYAG
jgi:ribosomal protein S18 acetylase RimI-like enzyme